MYTLKAIADNGREIEFGFDSGFVLAPTTLSNITVNLAMSQGVGQVGSTIQGRSVQPMAFPVNGEIVGSVGRKRQQLYDTILPDAIIKMVYNNTWELECVASGLPVIQNYDYNSKFQFVLTAAYPYWRTHDFTRISLSGIEPKFKLPFFSGEPFILGQRIQYLTFPVDNVGNVPMNFSVTFRAVTALKNPKITNVYTLEQIKINRSMDAGDMIVVDMTVSPMSVISIIGGVSKNIFGSLDIESVPFKLAVGTNLLQYGADENPGGLDCWLNLRPAVTGPYDKWAV